MIAEIGGGTIVISAVFIKGFDATPAVGRYAILVQTLFCRFFMQALTLKFKWIYKMFCVL